MTSKGTVFALAAAVLSMSPGCTPKEEPAAKRDAAAATSIATAAAPTCGPGLHPDTAGHCIPDADAAGPEATPSATPSASLTPPPGKCPELYNTERVYGFDWAKEFGVEAPLAAKLKGVSGAAAESMALSNEIENELRVACLGIAQTLGAKGPFVGAGATCQAAADAIRATREKLGTATKITVNAHQPVCTVPIPSDCAAACGGADAHAACEGNAAPVGACADNCDGVCEYAGAGKCDGNCQGRCDTGFSGTCTGTCMGKCNGADVAGTCAGKCEGTCDGNGRGVCKGVCRGGCQGTVHACPGVCLGKCSSPVRDPKCSASAKVDGTGPECSAYCVTRSVRKAICSPAVVNVTFAGSTDAAGAKLYQGAIEHGLPLILKVQRRLQGRIDALARNQPVVTTGLASITASNSPALPALGPCLFGGEKSVTEGIDRLKANFRSASLVATVAQGR